MMRDVSFSGCTAVAISTMNARIEERHSAATELKKTTQAASVKTDTASVSTLSRQLGESAIRAEARDKSMTRQQLGEFASSSIAHFSPESTSAKKALHDAEIPKTDDPELLERARQATIYVNKAAAQDPTAKNPFSALTREQAVLIAYDAKGPYTANERFAAWRHGNNLEEQWRAGLMARGWQESNNTGGRAPKFMTECLEHYKALPAIEQARYDAGYEGRLVSSIKEHGVPAKPNERKLNLYEILAEVQNPEKKKEHKTAIGKQPPPSTVKALHDEKPSAAAPDPVSSRDREFRVLSLFEILAGHRYPDNNAAKKQSSEVVDSSQKTPIAPQPTPTTNSLSPGASPTPADVRRS